MRAILLAGCGLAVLAQDTTVRGRLLEFEGSAAAGLVSVRDVAHRVHVFQLDDKTSIERDGMTVPADRLAPGDFIEIAFEPRGPVRRYARIVRVLTPAPARPLIARRRPRPSPLLTEQFAPRGNLTFAGVILRLSPERIVLHTRAGGETAILLRPDTRYIDSGSVVENPLLEVNMRVFIRGARNYNNDIEAYQIMWGAIRSPR